MGGETLPIIYTSDGIYNSFYYLLHYEKNCFKMRD